MSDYKRLFSYLYFYQRKIKEKNSGFVKVEIRNNQCRLQMSVKGGFLNQAPQWDVYGFMREGRKLCLWRLGRMNVGNGQGEWGAQMPFARFLGKAADLNHVAGLLLYGSRNTESLEWLPDVEDGGDGLVCATVWDDLPLVMPGEEPREAPREVLHAAQVDAPEERRTEAHLLTGTEPLPSAEGAGAMYETREEWDTLRELLEEKEVEQIMADRDAPSEPTVFIGPPRPVSVPEEPGWDGERNLRQEPPEVKQEPCHPEVPEERPELCHPEAPEAKREPCYSEVPGAKQEPFHPAPPEVKPEPCLSAPPEVKQEPCYPEVPEERPELCHPEAPEVRQEPFQPGSQAGAGTVREQPTGCPCPEQCIWSDMYQEPPKSLWEKLASFYPKLILNGMGSDWEILKIMPRDIGRLPRENWVYGNNSFLLHGYYRHHHLILACYKGTTPCQYYLGVPGTCSERERVMASMFGFTNYLPGGKRGYWYTPVNLGNN